MHLFLTETLETITVLLNIVYTKWYSMYQHFQCDKQKSNNLSKYILRLANYAAFNTLRKHYRANTERVFKSQRVLKMYP